LNLKNNESIFFFFISLTNIQNVKNNLGKCEKQFYVYMKGSVTNVKKNQCTIKMLDQFMPQKPA
jgi:hypothetical protein